MAATLIFIKHIMFRQGLVNSYETYRSQMITMLARVGLTPPQLAGLRWKLELIEQVSASFQKVIVLVIISFFQDSLLGPRGELLYTIEMDLMTRPGWVNFSARKLLSKKMAKDRVLCKNNRTNFISIIQPSFPIAQQFNGENLGLSILSRIPPVPSSLWFRLINVSNGELLNVSPWPRV